MNKITLIVSIIVVVLIVVAVGYFIYNNSVTPPVNTNTVPSTEILPNATTTPVTTQQQNLSASVAIENFAFNPATLTIKTGTVVTWTNNDPMPHQIKSAGFNSAPLSNGQSFQFTFSTVGEYDYSCAIHPSMKGKIIVTE